MREVSHIGLFSMGMGKWKHDIRILGRGGMGGKGREVSHIGLFSMGMGKWKQDIRILGSLQKQIPGPFTPNVGNISNSWGEVDGSDGFALDSRK